MIITTGFAEMELEARSRLPELSKPFTEAELADAILQHAKAAAEWPRA